jgi:hypothetical protein
MASLRPFASLTNAFRPLTSKHTTLLPLTSHTHSRHLHKSVPAQRIPPPTPFVPDATTFLTLIGRGLSTHASKIQSWDALFSLTSPQLAELGVEPPRARRYLLRWRDKFRNGEFGVGGDLKKVVDGIGEVRLVEVPISTSEDGTAGKATITRSPGMMKRIVNVDPSSPLSEMELVKAPRVAQLKIKDSHMIYGPHVELVKGSNGRAAVIKVKEGIWEHRRGHKVDGGERRKAEVRAKRRAAERKAGRA